MIEEGEQPEQVARRESMEESGCEIKKLERINTYYVSPGGCSEKIILYFASIDSTGLDGTVAGVDHGSKWKRYLTRGVINNATTLIGLQWLQIQKLSNKL